MTRTPLDGDRIGPELDLADVTFPPHVGDRLAAFYDRAERMTTAREWADAVAAAIRDERGRGPAEADMCTADDGAHAVAFDGDGGESSTSYVCVLDPLMAVFLRGEPGTVRSTTPADGAEVTFEIAEDGVTVDPRDAVLSFGVGHDVPESAPTLEAAYGQLCAYGHAFAAGEEYERWAAGVDAATTTLAPGTGVALARELARAVAG